MVPGGMVECALLSAMDKNAKKESTTKRVRKEMFLKAIGFWMKQVVIVVVVARSVDSMRCMANSFGPLYIGKDEDFVSS